MLIVSRNTTRKMNATDLGRQQILLPLGDERVVHKLLLHVCVRKKGEKDGPGPTIYAPFSPRPLQSMPSLESPSVICRLLISARVSMGGRPLFSASARGTASNAEANARIAYCSMDAICNTVR
jgi:hypothetical protein